jgi:hypothetical protein
MLTHFHSTSVTAAPSIQWIERELGDAWRHLRGRRSDERRAAHREAPAATELCGEVAEFVGLLGEEEE